MPIPLRSKLIFDLETDKCTVVYEDGSTYESKHYDLKFECTHSDLQITHWPQKSIRKENKNPIPKWATK